MTRIQLPAVHAAIDHAARRITDAAGDDAKVDKAELKAAVAGLSGTEKQLVDVFSRFVTNRSGRPAEGLSERDVQEAVAYAKASMITRYDLDGDGLSADEVKKMSRTGQLAVKLAEELGLVGSVEGPDLTTGGESWFELRERVTIDSRVKITDPAGLDLTRAEQIIAACQDDAFPEVTSLADAFAAVDMGEFAITEFTDPASGRSYVGIDFGAGDSTYGAIFESGSAEVAYAIQDNSVELPSSPAPAPTPPNGAGLSLGDTWSDVLARSEVKGRETITDVTGLDELVLGEQIVAAVHQSTYTHVTNSAEALAAVDEGGFVVTHFNDLQTGKQFIGIDYGAGDNTYGAIFEADSSRPTFAIQDGELAAPRKPVGKPITSGGETFGDVLARVELLSQSTIKTPSEVTDELQAQQLLIAARLGLFSEPATLEAAFRDIDQGGFEVREFFDPASGKAYVSVDFGAGGGNTFGAIFESGSTEVAIAIIDGLMEE